MASSKANEELLLEEWQERLGLQDWVIVLRYNCKEEDLQLEDAVGETEWTNTIKTAVIRIVSEEAYGDRIVKYDFEKILVHELLHVKFQYLQLTGESFEKRLYDEMLHQLIEDLAQSLVLAKRGLTNRVQQNIDVKKVRNFKE